MGCLHENGGADAGRRGRCPGRPRRGRMMPDTMMPGLVPGAGPDLPPSLEASAPAAKASWPGFLFATGIENSAPTIEGGRVRRDQMEDLHHYSRWREDFALVRELGISFLRYGP